jgi:drug/metabolite transporter (DMT)-like permease
VPGPATSTAAAARSPYVPLLLGVLCVSTGSILVRLAQAPALAVSFQRVLIASLLLAPFALRPLLRAWPDVGRRQRSALLGCGIALAVHFATWIASLSYTSVASSVLLVNTAPLFSIAFSRVFLHESVSRTVALATFLALAGAGLVALGDWGRGEHSLLGDALALAGAVALSAYHVIGRGLRGALPLNAYVLAVWSVATVTLAGLAVASRVPLWSYSGRTFAIFVALALLPMLGGHGLVNVSLRLLPAPTVGLFLLGEPVGATLLALLLFGEVPGPLTVVGGAVVIGALALVVAGPDR